MLHIRDSRPPNSAGATGLPWTQDTEHPQGVAFGALAVAGVYLAFGALARLWVSPTLDLDQSEQALLSQGLAWGYSEQAPLYTWLTRLGFGLFGLTPGVLYGLKALTLFGSVAALCWLGGQIGCSRARQWAVLVGLVFLPQFIWESQRDVTHTCLATCFCCWALALCLWARSRPQPVAGLVALGLTLAAALLSKYNSALLLPAVALILHGPGPERLPLKYAPWWLTALVLAVLPHGLWALDHSALQQRGLDKLFTAEGGTLQALLTTGLCALAFTTPLWLFALANHPRTPSDWQRRQWRRGRALAGIVLASVALLVVLGETRGFKERWLQPLLTWTALWFATGLRLDGLSYRITRGLALVLALAVSFALNGRIVWSEALGEAPRPNLPYQALATSLRAGLGKAPPCIVAESKLLGGNLRMQFRETLVLSPEVAAALPAPEGRCLLVCETEACDKPALTAWLDQHRLSVPDRLERISARLLYHREQTHGLSFGWLDLAAPWTP